MPARKPKTDKFVLTVPGHLPLGDAITVKAGLLAAMDGGPGPFVVELDGAGATVPGLQMVLALGRSLRQRGAFGGYGPLAGAQLAYFGIEGVSA